MKAALFAVSFSALLARPQSDAMSLLSFMASRSGGLTPGITRREESVQASNLAHDIRAISGRVHAVVMPLPLSDHSR